MLWSRAVGRLTFDQLSPGVIAGWLQAATTLLVLIVVWMTFVGLLMRFVWTPALLDAALPFIVGLLQFSVIEASTPDRFGLWLIGLGVLSAVMAMLTQRYFKRARAEPRNAEFFQKVAPATWKDFVQAALSTVYGFLFGIALLIYDVNPGIMIVIMLPMIISLIFSIIDQNRYWVLSIPPSPDPARDAA